MLNIILQISPPAASLNLEPHSLMSLHRVTFARAKVHPSRASSFSLSCDETRSHSGLILSATGSVLEYTPSCIWSTSSVCLVFFSGGVSAWGPFQHWSCPRVNQRCWVRAVEPPPLCLSFFYLSLSHSLSFPPSVLVSPCSSLNTQNALSWRLPTMLPPPTVAGGPSQPWTRTAKSQTERSARSHRRSPSPSTKTGWFCTTGRSLSPLKR